MGSDADLKHYYAARAAEYDQVYAKPERQADLAAMAAWLPLWFEGRRVLEVACGTGWWSRLIAPVSRTLTGLDAAEEPLAIARQRVGASPTVRWVVGDAYALPPDLGPFDACFAGFWYSHVPRRRGGEFLHGVAKALEPGARVVMIDNRDVPGSSTPIEPPDAHGDTWQRRRLEDGSEHRVLKNYPTDEALHTAFADLATGIEIVHWTHYWALSCRLR